jgi:hypothetical protein
MSAHKIQKPGYSNHDESFKLIIKVKLLLSKPTPLIHAGTITTNLQTFETLALYGCELAVLRASRFVSLHLPTTDTYYMRHSADLGWVENREIAVLWRREGAKTVEPVHLI